MHADALTAGRERPVEPEPGEGGPEYYVRLRNAFEVHEAQVLQQALVPETDVELVQGWKDKKLAHIHQYGTINHAFKPDASFDGKVPLPAPTVAVGELFRALDKVPGDNYKRVANILNGAGAGQQALRTLMRGLTSGGRGLMTDDDFAPP